MNTCTLCNETKPLSNFRKNPKMTRGIINQCNICLVIRERGYYEKDKERIDKYRAEWWKNNKEKKRVYAAKDYEKHKDKIIEYAVIYRATHKEQMRKYRKKYYMENKEYINKKYTVWAKSNQKKRVASHNRYVAKARNLPATLTVKEWGFTLKLFDSRCVYCGDPWEHQDHLMPVDLGGGYIKENIVPACKTCNSSKRNAHPTDWIEEDKLAWILATIGLEELPVVYIT